MREEWEEILEIIIGIESKEENLIVIGDANRHIGSYVKGNHPKTSVGGKLLLDLLAKEDYTLVNALDHVVNGPFTRYDPNDPYNNDKKSLLDIVIVSSNLKKFIDKLEIDSDLQWTPSRAVKGTLKFPDHYALLLTLKHIPMKLSQSFPPKKHVVWNTRKKMGWNKYKERTEMNKRLLKLAEFKDADPKHLYKQIEKELNSIKYAVFGKVKVSETNKNVRQLEQLQVKKNAIVNSNAVDKTERLEKVDKEMASTLKNIEKENYEKDIKYLEGLKNEKGKSAAVFGLREKILGNKKRPQERVVLSDPKTGKDVSTPAEIKKVSLNYLVDLLSKKTVKDEYADVLNAKRELTSRE